MLLSMGIYSNGNIFGIRMYKFNEEEDSVTLYEQKWEEIMSAEQMREAYLFYTQIQANEANNIFFKFYTECSSTLDCKNKDVYYAWHPMPLNTFVEKFGI